MGGGGERGTWTGHLLVLLKATFMAQGSVLLRQNGHLGSCEALARLDCEWMYEGRGHRGLR